MLLVVEEFAIAGEDAECVYGVEDAVCFFVYLMGNEKDSEERSDICEVRAGEVDGFGYGQYVFVDA